MPFLRRILRYRSTPALLVFLTLASGGLFKASAFAREAFIAAKFGLSAVTDAYFGLQQFPLTLGTFMFGAFCLAFTPAYADARQRSKAVGWLPGLLLYGLLTATALAVLMVACSGFVLRSIHTTGTADIQRILIILSACFLPIITIGIWSGICTASGRYLSAAILSGVPYLLMTLVLFGIYAAGSLDNLSLPLSMTVGFVIVGIYSFLRIIGSQPFPRSISQLFLIWKFQDFRHFLRQLVASSCENGGFAANQLLLLHFISLSGTGVLSANNCAMRVGMLGYSLVAQPLAQLVQSRLCCVADREKQALFRRAIVNTGAAVLFLAVILLVLRFPVIRLVYMHGKFTAIEVGRVAALLPAWLAYFVVLSMNGIVARFLFIRSQGAVYVRRQLWAYAVSNVLRLAIAGSVGAAWIIWSSVAAEFIAFLLNLRTCVAVPRPCEVATPVPAGIKDYDVQPS